jgi:hypothetical protein
MGEQRLVAPRLILLRSVSTLRKAADCRFDLQQSSAGIPQRVLQTFDQCLDALTTEHDKAMLPSREG